MKNIVLALIVVVFLAACASTMKIKNTICAGDPADLSNCSSSELLIDSKGSVF